jgi:transcriptional regulator
MNLTILLKQKKKLHHAYQTLELPPVVREREYHFNEQNQIKSIYTIKVKSEPVHEKFDKYFGLWATIYYPEMDDKIRAKMENGEDIFEERHFLLLKLKEDGLDMLDSAISIYNTYLEEKSYKENLPAAPLNDYVFEKIMATATALIPSGYSNESPMSPSELKSILEKAFENHGFSYNNTINQIAEYGFTTSEFQYVAIVVMPVEKIETEAELENVYSGKELESVRKIIQLMNNY